MSDDTGVSSASSSTPAAVNDTVQSGIFVVPSNLDFNFSGNFKSVKFNNLDMTDVSGQILVKNGKVDLKNVKMNALDGSLLANGYYDTSTKSGQPEVSIDLDIKNASFAKTFTAFETVKKLAPIFETLAGNFSTTFKMKSLLGADFMPVLTNLDVQGLLQSNSVEVQKSEVMSLIASTLKNEDLKNLKIKDLKLPFSISDGRVTTKPFDINFNGGKMSLSGSTGLDQTIDYVAKIDLPQDLTKGYANKVNLKIGGTFTNPKVSVDAADLANQAINKLVGSVLGGNDSTSVTEKVNAEIGKQADEIRKQAKEAGDKLISEAEKQGENLISEANKTKNPLAKAAAVAAAQTAAKKLKEEAEKQSKKIYEEAEKKINSLETGSKNQLK
jgi:lysophospholipase L1-like esterase